jgi:hypothetical protein
MAEDEGDTLLQNTGIPLQLYMMSQPKRLQAGY